MIPKYYKERKEKTNFEKNSSTTTFTEKKNFYMVCSIVSFPKKGRGTICLVSSRKKNYYIYKKHL